MEVLILVPYYYSLKNSLVAGFEDNYCKVIVSSFDEVHARYVNMVNIKTTGFPYKIRKHWDKWLIENTQLKYISLYNAIKPDIVLIYNNEHIQPDTIKEFKKKSKIVFLLGDNPLLSQTDTHNLTILEQADYIICPDSYWKQQLELIGIKNIVMDFIGTNQEIFYPIVGFDKNGTKRISFIGRTYRNADGYKRAKFLAEFSKFDLSVHTHFDPYWNVWLNYFPELKKHINFLSSPLENEKVNILYNESAIALVDSNSGLINGIHLRFFDILASGCLPLIEYKIDYEKIFENFNLPLIRNYGEIEGQIEKWLLNEKLRKELITELSNYTFRLYNQKDFVRRMLNNLFK